MCTVIQWWISQLTKYICVFWHLGPRGWLAWFFSYTQSLSLHTSYFPQTWGQYLLYYYYYYAKTQLKWRTRGETSTTVPVPASAPVWLLVCFCAWEAGRSAAIYSSVWLYYTHTQTLYMGLITLHRGAPYLPSNQSCLFGSDADATSKGSDQHLSLLLIYLLIIFTDECTMHGLFMLSHPQLALHSPINYINEMIFQKHWARHGGRSQKLSLHRISKQQIKRINIQNSRIIEGKDEKTYQIKDRL